METNTLPKESLDSLLFKALMEKAADSIYFKDKDGRFIRVSNRMVGLFNMDHPTQVEGKMVSEFFAAEHAEASMAADTEIIKSGLPKLDMEEKEIWPDGSITWASTSKFPLYDDDGNLLGTFGISRDITARKEAEEKLAVAQRELIEEEKKAAVAEFSNTVLANVGSSGLEIKQTLDRVLEQLRQAKTSPEALAKAQEDVKELRFVAQRLVDLMKLQG